METTFRNDRHRALMAVLKAEVFIKDQMKRVIGDFGITLQQYFIMSIINDHKDEELSTLQIKAELFDKCSDTSRVVDRMCRDGLVDKTTSPKDKRKVIVKLTKKSNDILKKINETGNARLDEIMGKLDKGEATQLNFLLLKAIE